jgi:VanZ family protein
MNKIIMNNSKKNLRWSFYSINFIIIIFYLFPGNIFELIIDNNLETKSDTYVNPFMLFSHFFGFAILSFSGIFTYKKTGKINFLILYLIFLSIILEISHLFISNREFELSDLFQNIAGVVFITLIYNVKNRYV